MKIETGKTYWVENPKHGTIKAVALIVGKEGTSLAFQLGTTIGSANGRMGGMMISDKLLLVVEKGVARCLFTQEVWTIYEHEPAVKLPTK